VDARFDAILRLDAEASQRKNSQGQLPIHLALLNEHSGDGPLHIIAALLGSYPRCMANNAGLHDRIARRMMQCQDDALQRRLTRYLREGSVIPLYGRMCSILGIS